MPMAKHEATNAATGETVVHVIPWTSAALKEWLASVRYEKEVAGVTVAGLPVSTERGNERTTWQQLLSSARADAGFTFRKKMAGQFHTLTASQIILCAGVGLRYITDCFAREDSFHAAIDAATTPEQLDAIEVQVLSPSSWPSRSYNADGNPQ